MSYKGYGFNRLESPIYIKELSTLVGVSVATLNRLKAKEKLPHHKIGGRVVFFPSDVEEFLSSCAVKATNEGER